MTMLIIFKRLFLSPARCVSRVAQVFHEQAALSRMAGGSLVARSLVSSGRRFIKVPFPSSYCFSGMVSYLIIHNCITLSRSLQVHCFSYKMSVKGGLASFLNKISLCRLFKAASLLKK